MVSSERRSTRVRKRPETVYDDAAAVLEEVAEAAEEEDASSEESDGELDAATKRAFSSKKKKKPAAEKKNKPVAKKKKKNQKDVCPLYDACMVTPPKKSKKAKHDDDTGPQEDPQILEAVEDWVASFGEDEEEAESAKAGSELLKFVFAASGATDVDSVVGAEVKIVNLESAEWESLKSSVVSQLEERPQPLLYPLLAKEELFRERFGATWRAIAKVSRSSEGALEAAMTLAIALSSAKVAHIRHTATCAAMELGQGLAVAASALEGQLAVAERQLRGQDEAAPAKGSKAEMVLQRAKTLRNELSIVDSLSQRVFDSVFAVRYRDTNAAIRATCIEAFGRWLEARPRFYVDEKYLKYFAWYINFESPAERLASMRLLAKLYESSSNSSDDDEATAPLDLIAERYTYRIAQIAHDVDADCQLAALQLLGAMHASGSLSNEDVDVEGVEEAAALLRAKILDFEATPEVRCLALELSLKLEGFDEIQDAPNTTKLLEMARFVGARVVIGEDLEAVELVALALLDLPAHRPMATDWAAFVSLLEADAQDTFGENETRSVAVLVRLLRSSAKSVKEDEAKEETLGSALAGLLGTYTDLEEITEPLLMIPRFLLLSQKAAKEARGITAAVVAHMDRATSRRVAMQAGATLATLHDAGIRQVEAQVHQLANRLATLIIRLATASSTESSRAELEATLLRLGSLANAMDLRSLCLGQETGEQISVSLCDIALADNGSVTGALELLGTLAQWEADALLKTAALEGESPKKKQKKGNKSDASSDEEEEEEEDSEETTTAGCFVKAFAAAVKTASSSELELIGLASDVRVAWNPRLKECVGLGRLGLGDEDDATLRTAALECLNGGQCDDDLAAFARLAMCTCSAERVDVDLVATLLHRLCSSSSSSSLSDVVLARLGKEASSTGNAQCHVAALGLAAANDDEGLLEELAEKLCVRVSGEAVRQIVVAGVERARDGDPRFYTALLPYLAALKKKKKQPRETKADAAKRSKALLKLRETFKPAEEDEEDEEDEEKAAFIEALMDDLATKKRPPPKKKKKRKADSEEEEESDDDEFGVISSQGKKQKKAVKRPATKKKKKKPKKKEQPLSSSSEDEEEETAPPPKKKSAAPAPAPSKKKPKEKPPPSSSEDEETAPPPKKKRDAAPAPKKKAKDKPPPSSSSEEEEETAPPPKKKAPAPAKKKAKDKPPPSSSSEDEEDAPPPKKKRDAAPAPIPATKTNKKAKDKPPPPSSSDEEDAPPPKKKRDAPAPAPVPAAAERPRYASEDDDDDDDDEEDRPAPLRKSRTAQRRSTTSMLRRSSEERDNSTLGAIDEDSQSSVGGNSEDEKPASSSKNKRKNNSQPSSQSSDDEALPARPFNTRLARTWDD